LLAMIMLKTSAKSRADGTDQRPKPSEVIVAPQTRLPFKVMLRSMGNHKFWETKHHL
jgi:hypothetical protein